jgi:ATP-dependent DNA helicase RecG
MTSETILKLIEGGETEQVEFKSGVTSPDMICRVVGAFLNGRGGRVLIGVGPNGRLLGLENPSEASEMIARELSKRISPKALWNVETVTVSDKTLLVIEVPEGMDKPYVFSGSIFFRRGEAVVPANRDEISRLIQNRAVASLRWERQLAMGADLDDLDRTLVQETLSMAKQSERWQESSDDTVRFLNAHGLLSQGGVTNAAVLLYAKEPTKFLPQVRVRLLVLPEGKTGDRYAADKTFDRCLLRVAKEIPEALESRIGGVESTFSDGWQRHDHPLYPVTALREAVMNALIHRDYEAYGSITISVLPRSLKVSNPGALPDALKPSDLKRDHPSLPRNPDVAHICFLHGLIEKVGRGTQRIVEDCRRVKIKEPKWESTTAQTTLTFFSSNRTKERTALQTLAPREKKIVELLRDEGAMRAMQIANSLGANVTSRTVRTDLLRLVENGFIIRHGRGPSTLYSVPETKEGNRT